MGTTFSYLVSKAHTLLTRKKMHMYVKELLLLIDSYCPWQDIKGLLLSVLLLNDSFWFSKRCEIWKNLHSWYIVLPEFVIVKKILYFIFCGCMHHSFTWSTFVFEKRKRFFVEILNRVICTLIRNIVLLSVLQKKVVCIFAAKVSCRRTARLFCFRLRFLEKLTSVYISYWNSSGRQKHTLQIKSIPIIF